MNKKLLTDCAFQYYKSGKMVEDTGLITREKADELWKEHIEDFKLACGRELEAEIAIWINLDEDMMYDKTAKHFNSVDVFCDGGQVYTKEWVR